MSDKCVQIRDAGDQRSEAARSKLVKQLRTRPISDVLWIGDVFCQRFRNGEFGLGGAWKIDFAHDGLAGLLCAKQNNYDLILTSMHPPTLPGLEVIRAIRDCPGLNQQTPIIMLSDDAKDPQIMLAEDYEAEVFGSHFFCLSLRQAAQDQKSMLN